MRRMALVGGLLLALASCRNEAARPRPLLAGLMNLAAEQGERPAAVAASLREIERMADKVAEAQRGGRDAVAALRQVVFTELGYTREVDSPDLRFVLLPSVMAARKGSCVGLGTLYLALAEQLGLPLEGVLVPGHFFVRARAGGEIINVELLHAGETTTDDFYHQRYPTNDPPPRAYWRGLTVPEVLAVVLFNVGNQQREQKHYDDAADLYRRSARAFPAFAEANASRGLSLHLAGRLKEAHAAYEAAHRERPDLPGLDRNIAALDADLKLAAARPVQARGVK
jgi:regulator of sirC expression with transglutaminase-like and TPR domain